MSKKLSPASGFVRETQKDLYSLYNAGAEASDFYFYADYLHNVEVQFNDEKYVFSYEHCPVENNPYHFQFYTKDQNGEKLPRQAKKKSEQNRNKAIADVIFENILSAAVCFDTSKLISCI